MRGGRPHVTFKLAVSADEKAGLAGRRPVAITGPEAQARVHMLRAQSDAVLIGIGTALADDPLLTCRLPGMAERSPVRVVLDTHLRLAPASKLAASAHEVPVWVMCGTEAPAANEEALRTCGVDVLPANVRDGRIDLAAALRLLAHKGITRLMVEGGPITAASFLAADLVDEAVVLRGPNALGVDAIDALEGLPLSVLTASPRLISQGRKSVGADTIETFERAD
jgi:diaminohydroxyphosphoribosylaminopyrimidine deaminase/5-amino-6-(5-phosphoribosylamino)uracil reductase